MGPPRFRGIPSVSSPVGRRSFRVTVREGPWAPCSVIRCEGCRGALHAPTPGYAFTVGPVTCRVSRSTLAASAPFCLRIHGLRCPACRVRVASPLGLRAGMDCVSRPPLRGPFRFQVREP